MITIALGILLGLVLFGLFGEFIAAALSWLFAFALVLMLLGLTAAGLLALYCAVFV